MDFDKDVPYSWERDRASEKALGLTSVSIFFAVLGAILAAWLIREVYQDWQMQRALQIMNQQLQNITQQSQEQSRSMIEHQRRVKEAAEEKARLIKANEAKKINERRAAEARLIEEAARKEAAWKAYYKPIENCSDGRSESTVLCGNDYMRARKKFEESWH